MAGSGEKVRAVIRPLTWFRDNVPCVAACPVTTDAGRYVQLIGAGRYDEAYAVARSPNPIASICGRTCGAPCEDACRRGSIDAPVAIRPLKRFVTERFGPEAFSPMAVDAHSEDGGAQQPEHDAGASRSVVAAARCGRQGRRDRRRPRRPGVRARPGGARISGHRLRSHGTRRRHDALRHPRVPLAARGHRPAGRGDPAAGRRIPVQPCARRAISAFASCAPPATPPSSSASAPAAAVTWPSRGTTSTA